MNEAVLTAIEEHALRPEAHFGEVLREAMERSNRTQMASPTGSRTAGPRQGLDIGGALVAA
jgi:hypothetical protein